MLACFSKPLILNFHFLSSCVCSQSLIALKESVLWWVEQYKLAEGPRSIAQGRPADNYKPFSKHNSAAHGDILMARTIVKQSSNEAETTKRGVHESYNSGYQIGNTDRSCKGNKGTLDSLKRMEFKRGKTTAELMV